MTTVAQAIIGGRRLGRHAAVMGRPVTDCPYPARSPDKVVEAGRYAWLQAYRARRPHPDGGGLLSDLDALAAGTHEGTVVDGRAVVAEPPPQNLF